jgi:hypothetical protein
VWPNYIDYKKRCEKNQDVLYLNGMEPIEDNLKKIIIDLEKLLE